MRSPVVAGGSGSQHDGDHGELAAAEPLGQREGGVAQLLQAPLPADVPHALGHCQDRRGEVVDIVPAPHPRVVERGLAAQELHRVGVLPEGQGAGLEVDEPPGGVEDEPGARVLDHRRRRQAGGEDVPEQAAVELDPGVDERAARRRGRDLEGGRAERSGGDLLRGPVRTGGSFKVK